MGLIKIADQCSFFRLKEFFAHVAAFIAFQLSRRKRRLKERGLSQALQLSEPAIRNIVKQSFYDFWYDIFVALSPSRGKQPGQVKTELRGVEHLKEALGKGSGVILWESSFFGRRCLAKRILHENAFSVCQVHSENHMGGFRNPRSWISKHLIQPFFDNRERPFVKEIILLSRSDSLAFTRDLLGQLKQNDIISIAADGRIGHRFIPVEFLGRKDSLSTGMVNLARLSGATILPLFCVQEGGNRTSLIVESPIRIDWEGDREGSLERSVLQYVSLLESYIKRYPEQYRNWNFSERPL